MLKINDDYMVEVFNNYSSSIGYTTDKITRVWPFPGSSKKIKLEELYEAWNLAGGRQLFESGALLIKDTAAREALGMEELDKYTPDTEAVKNLLLNESDQEFEEILMYCSDAILEKIVDMSISLPVQSMSKMQLIKKYSGKSVYEMIQELQLDNISEEKAKESVEESRPKRRVPKE